ncbi:insulinase family protein [Pseudomonadales bacterium]|nr:insulinase family protein [Pseudomonadales bacterium]
MNRTLILFLAFLSWTTFSFADLSQLPDKAATDQSEYRMLTLDNGLKVVLLSDPDLNKSSASLVAWVGSYNDPEDRAGLAHFLEHMLFLGSEKFPGESEYGNYLKSNGGYSNAYTSGDHTNYHFEISHQAFNGALDRFSQFFISPLFNADYTEREMNAVDSEFEKNLQSDNWRQQEIFRTLVDEKHPENHFSIGNLKSLEGIDRQEFMSFYERYYSANQMALAMTSNNSLDQMEQWARHYFAAIENRNIAPVDYTTDLIDQSRAPSLALVEPVKDLRKLSLAFPVRGTRAMYRSKPDDLIGFMLGYEGEGSLLSHLKNEGLATALSGGSYKATKDYSMFYIEIELTPKGADKWQDVMEATFASAEMLRQSDYPEYLFQERATMARLNELFRNKGEGTGRAVNLANNALHYSLKDAARIAYLWEEPDADQYFGILQAIRVENMIATLEAKGVPTDLTEDQFGVRYSLQAFSDAQLAAFNSPDEIAALSLPAANKYVPSNVDQLADAPVKVIDEAGLKLYYAQDNAFERPQVSYQIRLRQTKDMGELKNVVLRAYYVSVLNEIINEQTYTASVAGLNLNVGAGSEGITLSVSGYSQSAKSLVDDVLKQMRMVELPKARFEAIKERKLRALENAVFADAYIQAREIQRKVLYENYFTPKQRLAVARDLDLEDVQKFAKALFKRSNVEMMAYGNITQLEAEQVARSVVSRLKLKPIAKKDVYRNRTLDLTELDSVVAANVLKVNNSAYWQAFSLGEATAKNRAAAGMIRNFFADLYFSEIRTRQQLGYITGGFTSEIEKNMFALFVIQSADYTANELRKRSEAFLTTLPSLFDELADEKLEQIRAAVRADLESKDKSVAERGARYFYLAFKKDENWTRNSEALEALDALTRDDLREMLIRIADRNETNDLTVMSMAEQHAESIDDVKTSFDDIDRWKRKQPYK